jgi:hypothetical protein
MKLKLLIALACSVLLMGIAACSLNEETASEAKPKQEAENATDLEQKFENIRKDGKRILLPKLVWDKVGRVFKFSKKDLVKSKKHYDELGNSAPMLFSNTYAKGNFLLLMNDDMNDKEINKYKEIMDKVSK